jgi:hypothetical protein
MVALHSTLPPQRETHHVAENCCNQDLSPTLKMTMAGRPFTLRRRLPQQTLLRCSSAQPVIPISETHKAIQHWVLLYFTAAGADPAACNNHGVSPLALARTIANYNVARFFADVP